MPENNTWVSVTKDLTIGGYRITVHPPTMQHFVTDHALYSKAWAKDSEHMIRMLAKDVAAKYASTIEQQLLAALATPEMKTKEEQKLAALKNYMEESIILSQKGLYEELKAYSSGGLVPAPKKASMAMVVGALHKAIPGLPQMREKCPVTGCTLSGATSPLVDVIVHLNDSHNWSRERIADWLETLDHDLTMHSPAEEVKDDDGN